MSLLLEELSKRVRLKMVMDDFVKYTAHFNLTELERKYLESCIKTAYAGGGADAFEALNKVLGKKFRDEIGKN